MPLLVVALGILLLLFLIICFKLNTFISLILVSFFVGTTEGMSLNQVLVSIENGMGTMLGSLALIIAFGAMLGRLITDCGAAQRIATTLIKYFGIRFIQWAMTITGCCLGFALFFEIGFLILLPLVLTIALNARLPLLYVGVPVVAALSVTHGFLPPHPGPTAIATLFHADIGKTLLYGILLGIPTAIISGPIFAHFLKSTDKPVLQEFCTSKQFEDHEMPSFTTSVTTILIPVFLMGFRALAELLLPNKNFLLPYAEFLGNPVTATLLAVLVAIFTFGLNCKRTMKAISDSMTSAIKAISMIILINGGGGSFKQILLDSHIGYYITQLLQGSHISPILMAWLIAALLRLTLGPATISAITAGGLVAPLISTSHIRPELMVIAVGSGSLFFSHVNDPGFWLFKEYFNLTIKETLCSWSVLETIISVCGLLGCLMLAAVL
ncbi:High-affinity gluconate transporter [Commensalibacter sp. Nvir]|uniref:gluconate:H+ symporter n=1 Tax=Commensalibacter sp. Nvir TaxID=3069817 RepID=UPI002D46772A|nr:High-affinity gluconate transporter [Commensalibacter sp. Nvir]